MGKQALEGIESGRAQLGGMKIYTLLERVALQRLEGSAFQECGYGTGVGYLFFDGWYHLMELWRFVYIARRL